jgi:hypothetical protein
MSRIRQLLGTVLLGLLASHLASAHRVEAQLIIPTGRYSNDREINPSSGFFSFDPYWAGTIFFAPQWEASYRVHYLWNARNYNPDTIYDAHSTQAGEAFHMNWTGSYEVLENTSGSRRRPRSSGAAQSSPVIPLPLAGAQMPEPSGSQHTAPPRCYLATIVAISSARLRTCF